MSAPAFVNADLTAPLPTGTVVLEASAGTGKTYTIAGFVTRYVAEGRARIDEILAVTFGRAATGELRARVRERLVCTREALADAQCARKSGDSVVALLAQGSDGEVAERRARLARALADFDSATVATTHQFCQQVLHFLGTAADLDPGTVLVESLADLVGEVCDDLYLSFSTNPALPPLGFGHEDARRIATAAVGDPHAVLLPQGSDLDSDPDLRVRFAEGVRREVDRRKRAARILGFDDLLSRVCAALADEVTGETARRRLQQRYCVVLVDEFQDTDPVQWDVLRLAFHGVRDLVVIGDPKQAIYAFRGADVRAYLAAAQEATSRQTLGTNWRSEARLLAGLETLFRGAALGHEEIVVRPVDAGVPAATLGPGTDPTPLRLRILGRQGLPLSRGKEIYVDDARQAVARDVAAQVVDLLQAGHTVTPRGEPERPLRAGDIAVLVRTGGHAGLVREALLGAGVPSVLTGTSSVFATPAAREWVVLLEALEQPHRIPRVRRLAVSSFVGMTAAEVDAAGDAGTDELAMRVRGWVDVLAERGVAALFATVTEQEGVAARLLRRRDGERTVTDLRHVAEALHAEAVDAQLGLAGLLSWLRGRVEEAQGDVDQERSRRLDTDAAAVQVATVHTSKGLEFPVVLVPFAWQETGGGGKNERHPRGHDASGRRTLHVGGEAAPGYREACAQEDAESAGEELRLLYVAATRAVSRLVLWWAPTTKTASGPLHRLLFASDPRAIPARVDVPGDDAARTRVTTLASAECSGLAVETVPAPVPAASLLRAVPGTASDLHAATFHRPLDATWRRTSYTALTAKAHEHAQAVGSEPEAPTKDDEADVDALRGAAVAVGDEPLKHVPSPMADLPGGRTFGTLVHAVLEHADLASTGDAGEQLRAAAEREVQRYGDAVAPAVLADALVPVVSTPLGPLAGGLSLREIERRDRLPELEFELPLAGGDRPVAEVRLGQVGEVLLDGLPGDDRVRPYADALRSPALAGQSLRGYLAGSIDVVLRISDTPGPRYVVTDYKTNRLAPRDVPLTAWHYRQSALDAAMAQAHYPLQALLYSVALHRFLRWRQPGYSPDEHLGGVLYLFLRGMCGGVATGDDTPGVWAWRPPGQVIVAVSDLLAGRTP